jgi:iron complex outermembrane receptor protein
MDYDNASGSWAGGELKFTRHLRQNDRITIGTEYRNSFKIAQSNYLWYQPPTSPTMKAMPFVDYNQSSHFTGVYGQGEFHLGPKVILNAGLRTDWYNVFGSTTNPRAALIYTPRKSTTLKFMAGSAFRPPSFSEMYAGGMFNVAAPELKPETIKSLETVWQQQIGKRMTFETRGFYNRIGRYIETDTVVVHGMNETVLVNSSGTAKGMEFELHGRLPKGMEGRMSYSVQDAHDTADGASLAYTPRHLGSMNLDVPLFKRLMTAGLEAQYMSRCLAANSASGYSSTPAMVNLTLSTRPLKYGFSFSASAYNLVGHSMSDPLAPYAEQTHTVPATSLLPDDRRTFRFKITWTSKGESSKSGTAKTDTGGPHSQEGN